MSSIHTKENFATLIEQNKGLIYKVTNSYCKDVDDRQDLFQEIVLQLWTAFDKYDAQYKLSTWMYRIALNVAISFYRKQSKRVDNNYPLTENMIDIADDTHHTELESNISQLQSFINELKELDKALMILYLEENSYREIAEILGISETNTASKISRIKEQLKQKFKQINNQ